MSMESSIKNISKLLIGAGLLIFQTACMNKAKEMVRDAKYSAYEAVGLEKRDLFKRRVLAVKEAQGDTKEDFKDALEQLKSVYKYDGGKLERAYNRLYNDYMDAKESAQEVTENIDQLETVADDLFREWDKEIESMGTYELKARSREKLQQTQSKFNSLRTHLKNSESRMAPVLAKLNDQVLYVKHNLNASALAGLKTEANRIEKDIDRLIDQINKASKQADEVIQTL